MTYLQFDITVRALENFKGYIVEHSTRNENHQFYMNALVELENVDKLVEYYTIERDKLNTPKNQCTE